MTGSASPELRGSRFGVARISPPSAGRVTGDRSERIDPAVVERRADRRRAEGDRAGPDRRGDADELGLAPRARKAKPTRCVLVDRLDRSEPGPSVRPAMSTKSNGVTWFCCKIAWI